MTTYFTLQGAELRESSGEDFSTIVKNGTLTIKGSPPTIEIDGHQVPVNRSAREPVKRIGRDFKFATSDVMGVYYVSLPAGLDDSVYDRFEELTGLMAEGKPLTLPKPAAAAAAAAAAIAKPVAAAAAAAKGAAEGAPEAAGSVAEQGAAKAGGLFETLKELGAKAAQDTAAMAAAIKAKAEHDFAQLQEQQKAKTAEQGA